MRAGVRYQVRPGVRPVTRPAEPALSPREQRRVRGGEPRGKTIVHFSIVEAVVLDDPHAPLSDVCTFGAYSPDTEGDRPLCGPAVSHHMSTDVDGGDNRMEKINVRVPETLLEEIDAEWERRGYSSKSEAIRDALRSWVNPPVTLSEETLDDLEESRKQIERGETYTPDEVRDRLGLNRNE